MSSNNCPARHWRPDVSVPTSTWWNTVARTSFIWEYVYIHSTWYGSTRCCHVLELIGEWLVFLTSWLHTLSSVCRLEWGEHLVSLKVLWLGLTLASPSCLFAQKRAILHQPKKLFGELSSSFQEDRRLPSIIFTACRMCTHIEQWVVIVVECLFACIACQWHFWWLRRKWVTYPVPFSHLSQSLSHNINPFHSVFFWHWHSVVHIPPPLCCLLPQLTDAF